MEKLLNQAGQYRQPPQVLRIPSRRHNRRSNSESRLDGRGMFSFCILKCLCGFIYKYMSAIGLVMCKFESFEKNSWAFAYCFFVGKNSPFIWINKWPFYMYIFKCWSAFMFFTDLVLFLLQPAHQMKGYMKPQSDRLPWSLLQSPSNRKQLVFDGFLSGTCLNTVLRISHRSQFIWVTEQLGSEMKRRL